MRVCARVCVEKKKNSQKPSARVCLRVREYLSLSLALCGTMSLVGKKKEKKRRRQSGIWVLTKKKK